MVKAAYSHRFSHAHASSSAYATHDVTSTHPQCPDSIPAQFLPKHGPLKVSTISSDRFSWAHIKQALVLYSFHLTLAKNYCALFLPLDTHSNSAKSFEPCKRFTAQICLFHTNGVECKILRLIRIVYRAELVHTPTHRKRERNNRCRCLCDMGRRQRSLIIDETFSGGTVFR